MNFRALIIIFFLGTLLAVSALPQESSDVYGADFQNKLKRFRGEPIRFGKRSPRVPIRFGKRGMMLPMYEEDY